MRKVYRNYSKPNWDLSAFNILPNILIEDINLLSQIIYFQIIKS